MGESTKYEYYKKSILDKLFSKKQKNIEIEIIKEHCIFLESKISEWGIEFEKRLNELEKIVKNQPLIKKYQKTLDIFMKNAQD